MLARREGGVIPAGGQQGGLRAGLAVLGFFAVVGSAILGGGALLQPGVVTPAALGAAVMTDLALPFEALSALLTAAMVGAIVLSRRKDA
jgi:NADH-quinone oxidoreductase subunit J